MQPNTSYKRDMLRETDFSSATDEFAAIKSRKVRT